MSRYLINAQTAEKPSRHVIFFPLLKITSVIGNRHFEKLVFAIEHLRRDLRFEIEPVRFDLNIFDHTL
jgi:hypothetical protein